MSWSDFERQVEIETENAKGKPTYADSPREGTTASGHAWRISRHFPTALYSEEMVQKAIAAALAVIAGAPAAQHVAEKSRRPGWGYWDGRTDFRTLYPTVYGVEVGIEVNGIMVCALVRHDATGSCPSGPCGNQQEIVTYTRPLDW